MTFVLLVCLQTFGLINVIFYQQILNYFKLLYAELYNPLHFLAAFLSFDFLFVGTLKHLKKYFP